MEDVSKMLEEQQRELERIRKKRGSRLDTDRVRYWLNLTFLVLTGAGTALYFVMGQQHPGMAVWAVALVVKIVEFYFRFMY